MQPPAASRSGVKKYQYAAFTRGFSKVSIETPDTTWFSDQPRRLIWSGCGSKLRGTGFEYRPVKRTSYLSSRLCIKAYSAPVAWSVQCCLYGSDVHHKNPWIHLIGEGHSPGFELPSIAVSPGVCRKRRRAIFTNTHESMLWRGVCSTVWQWRDAEAVQQPYSPVCFVSYSCSPVYMYTYYLQLLFTSQI